jgi:hypothetical protein
MAEMVRKALDTKLWPNDKDSQFNKMGQDCAGFGIIFKARRRLHTLRLRPLAQRRR